MDNPTARIVDFVRYVRTYLTGDEKGQAQIFCDRLFQVFGDGAPVPGTISGGDKRFQPLDQPHNGD